MIVVPNADAFRQRLNEVFNAFEHLRPVIESQIQEYRQDKASEAQLYEHHARIYIIDPFLEALGWNYKASPAGVMPNLVTELGADAPTGTASRRFFDYLGAERQSNKPLLLVEAKHPSHTLPGTAGEHPETLSKLLNNPRQVGGLTKEWYEHADQVRDYLHRIKAHTQKSPCRFLWTNGDWFVVIRDPALILSGTLQPEHVLLFQDRSTTLRESFRLWSELAYQQLVYQQEPVEPHLLSAIVDPSSLTWAVYGIWVRYSHATRIIVERQPTVTVQPFVLAGDDKGHVIRVKPASDKDYDELVHTPKEFDAHLARVREMASRLLDDTQRHIGHSLLLRSVDQYYASSAFAVFPGVHMMTCDDRTNDFLIVTGTDTHYLRGTHTAMGCPYHDAERCRQDGHLDGDHAAHVYQRRVDYPPHFFQSGEPYFCGDRRVFQIRSQQVNATNRSRAGIRSSRSNQALDGQAFCELASFETMLCCRACALEPACAKAKMFQLPCKPDGV